MHGKLFVMGYAVPEMLLNARDELAKDVDAIQKLENLGKNV